jgi:hypothetical protein
VKTCRIATVDRRKTNGAGNHSLSMNTNLHRYQQRLAKTDFIFGLAVAFCALPSVTLIWRAIYTLCN